MPPELAAGREPVRVNATVALGELTIAVSNAGDPIPDDALARLFQPFFRGHDRARQGLSLGLHIASEIARAHGGTLVVRPDEVATTFIFSRCRSLPIRNSFELYPIALLLR